MIGIPDECRQEAEEADRDDECLEVTPNFVRLRKVELSGTQRAKTARSNRPPRE